MAKTQVPTNPTVAQRMESLNTRSIQSCKAVWQVVQHRHIHGPAVVALLVETQIFQ